MSNPTFAGTVLQTLFRNIVHSIEKKNSVIAKTFYKEVVYYLLFALLFYYTVWRLAKHLKKQKFVSFHDPLPYGPWTWRYGIAWNDTNLIICSVFLFILFHGLLLFAGLKDFSENGSLLDHVNDIHVGPNFMRGNCSEGEVEQIIDFSVTVSDSIFGTDETMSIFILSNIEKSPLRLCFLAAEEQIISLAKSLQTLFFIQVLGTATICFLNFRDYAFNMLFFIAVCLYYFIYRNDQNEHIISGLFRQDKWPVLFFYIVCFAWKNWDLSYPQSAVVTIIVPKAPNRVASGLSKAEYRLLRLTKSKRSNELSKAILSAAQKSITLEIILFPVFALVSIVEPVTLALCKFLLSFISRPVIANDIEVSLKPKKLLWLTPACAGMIFAFNTSDGSNPSQNTMHLIAVALYGIIWFLNSKNFTNHARHPPFAATMIYGILVFQVFNYFVRKNKDYFPSSLDHGKDFVHAPLAFINMAKMCFFSELVLFAASL